MLLDSRIDICAEELFSLGFSDCKNMPPKIRSVYNKHAACLIEYFNSVYRLRLEKALGAEKADDFNIELCKVIKKCLESYRADAKTSSGEPTSFSRYFSVKLKFGVKRYIFAQNKKSALSRIDFDTQKIENQKSFAPQSPNVVRLKLNRLLKCADIVFLREQERVKAYRGAILTFFLLKEICKTQHFLDSRDIFTLLSPHSFFDGDVFCAFFSEQKLTLEKVAERFGKIRNDASRTKRVLLSRLESVMKKD